MPNYKQTRETPLSNGGKKKTDGFERKRLAQFESCRNFKLTEGSTEIACEMFPHVKHYGFTRVESTPNVKRRRQKPWHKSFHGWYEIYTRLRRRIRTHSEISTKESEYVHGVGIPIRYFNANWITFEIRPAPRQRRRIYGLLYIISLPPLCLHLGP